MLLVYTVIDELTGIRKNLAFTNYFVSASFAEVRSVAGVQILIIAGDLNAEPTLILSFSKGIAHTSIPVPRSKTFPKTSTITLPRSLQDHRTRFAKECVCVQATQKLLDLECSLRRGR